MDNFFQPNISLPQSSEASYQVTDSCYFPRMPFPANDSGYGSADSTRRSSFGSNSMSYPFFPSSMSSSSPVCQSPSGCVPAHTQQEVPFWPDDSVYYGTVRFGPRVQRHPARTRQSLPNLPSQNRPLPPLRPRHEARVSKHTQPPHPGRHLSLGSACQDMNPSVLSPALQLPSTESYQQTLAEDAEIRFYCPIQGCDTAKAKSGFARKSDLSRHMKLHQSEKLVCGLCRVNGRDSHGYSRKDNLKQ